MSAVRGVWAQRQAGQPVHLVTAEQKDSCCIKAFGGKWCSKKTSVLAAREFEWPK